VRDRTYFKEKIMQTIPVILINRLGSLGDVILITPIVKKIYFDHGGMCSIIVRTHWEEVFRNNPYVHKVIDGNQSIDFSKIDKFINLDFSYEKNPKMHIVDAYGSFAFGNSLFDRQCELHTTKNDKESAIRLKNELNNSYITIHMRNTHQANRNIPIEFWNNLIINTLNATSLSIVQIGTKTDYAFGGTDRLLDVRDRFSMQELREVINESELFIGIDSAPLHIAATTQTEIIAFFTSAHAKYRKPLRPLENFTAVEPDIDCYGCQVDLPLGSTLAVCRRNDNECVNRFSVENTVNLITSKIV
jgi:heptosyltransferase III